LTLLVGWLEAHPAHEPTPCFDVIEQVEEDDWGVAELDKFRFMWKAAIKIDVVWSWWPHAMVLVTLSLTSSTCSRHTDL